MKFSCRRTLRSSRVARLCVAFVVLVAGGFLAGLAIADPPTIDRTPRGQWSGFQNAGYPAAVADSLPTVWSPDSGIAWTADVPGYGQSSPVIGHQQVVVTSTSGPNKDRYHLTSFAIGSGEKRWQRDFDNPSPFANTPMVSRAAPSAIATATGFIAWFEGGLVVAVDPEGAIEWQQDLVKKYGEIEARHGLSASLEQDQRHVFVWVERTDDPYLLALDKRTGETVWKAAGIGATSWSSPRLIGVGDGHHLVCSGSGKIVGFDPASGERLWEFDEIANNSSCTPIPAGDSMFLIGASDGRGESASGPAAASNGLIEIRKDDDGMFAADFVWRADKATCTFGSPVVAGGRALFVNRAGILYQLDLKSGRQLSAARSDAGGIWATPIVAGDLVYLFGHQGDTAVISLTSGKEIAVNQTWDGQTWDGQTRDGAAESQDENARSKHVLYAATVAGETLLIRRGDRLFAITPHDKTGSP
ncbi:MAG: PQQ-binding-like beta-propeller repeat protein [Novipirellula sp. JB048]